MHQVQSHDHYRNMTVIELMRHTLMVRSGVLTIAIVEAYVTVGKCLPYGLLHCRITTSEFR